VNSLRLKILPFSGVDVYLNNKNEDERECNIINQHRRATNTKSSNIHFHIHVLLLCSQIMHYNC